MGAGLSAVRYFVVGAKIVTLARFYLLSATANVCLMLTILVFSITQGYTELTIQYSVLTILALIGFCQAYRLNTIIDVYGNSGNTSITVSELESINNLDDLLNNPNKLSGVNEKDLYNYLVDCGYDVKPLSQGSLKGIPFEEGGGFKVNWGGDRILQYHPESRSHHGGAYFKISSGETGTIRIDLDGNIID